MSGWRFTDDVRRYADRAWDLLARDPAEQTIALTVVDAARAGHRWGDGAPLFGWYQDGGAVAGAVSMTPPFELLLAVVPPATVAGLVAALRDTGAAIPGVHGTPADTDRFAAAWTAGTSLSATVATELRLHELGTLRPPASPPAGRGRPAGQHDLELVARRLDAFNAETGTPGGARSLARTGIADGRLWLWEDASGTPVSLAGRTPAVAGVARIAPVYTPPEHRGRGYGAAVTAACAADALSRGADRLVLFTDAANPTANALYRRLGFEPRTDRRTVRFQSRS